MPTQKVGIMAFAVKKTKCTGCRTPIADGQLLCPHCAPKVAEIYASKLAIVNECEEKFARLWTQCQRCQGSLHQDVICSARDCALYYARVKSATLAREATVELSRFGW